MLPHATALNGVDHDRGMIKISRDWICVAIEDWIRLFNLLLYRCCGPCLEHVNEILSTILIYYIVCLLALLL